jgi:hypothetical protein
MAGIARRHGCFRRPQLRLSPVWATMAGRPAWHRNHIYRRRQWVGQSAGDDLRRPDTRATAKRRDPHLLARRGLSRPDRPGRRRRLCKHWLWIMCWRYHIAHSTMILFLQSGRRLVGTFLARITLYPKGQFFVPVAPNLLTAGQHVGACLIDAHHGLFPTFLQANWANALVLLCRIIPLGVLSRAVDLWV